MKIESRKNQTILKEVYNTITLETRDGKQLHICMRDLGFEMKINNGEWHLITNESDFLIKPNTNKQKDSNSNLDEINKNLYQKFSDFGFNYWLSKNGQHKRIDYLSMNDLMPLDDSERTIINSFAIRWLEEDKKMIVDVDYIISIDHQNYFKSDIYLIDEEGDVDRIVIVEGKYTNRPAAEHAALCEALKVLNI